MIGRPRSWWSRGFWRTFAFFLIGEALLGRFLSLEADSLAAVLNLDCDADPLDIREVGNPSSMTSQGLPSSPLTNSKEPESTVILWFLSMKLTMVVTALRTSDLKLKSLGCSGISSAVSSRKYFFFSSLKAERSFLRPGCSLTF